jgi:hypothetical protein
MKTNPSSKPNALTTGALATKSLPPRTANKSAAHRYERRKIREQLRHLDWALAGVD